MKMATFPSSMLMNRVNFIKLMPLINKLERFSLSNLSNKHLRVRPDYMLNLTSLPGFSLECDQALLTNIRVG